jgi:hypothetical protein
MALAGATTVAADRIPGARQRASWLAAAIPPFGVSYYRLRITDIQPFDPTGGAAADREDRRAGVPVRSLSSSQLGVTLVQTLIPGVHAGATLKYLRGTVRRARADGLLPPEDLLALGDELEGGEAEGRFDADVGVLAVAGPLRLGIVARNLREPEFGAGANGEAGGGVSLPRQVRVGAAFAALEVAGPPLTVALDADVRGYATPLGERRVVAIGAEQWFLASRLGVRAGGRFNTAGGREKAGTAGLSVAVRPGVFVDAHAVRGGSSDDEGWGLAARVSF